jgi:hypothetical protein
MDDGYLAELAREMALLPSGRGLTPWGCARLCDTLESWTTSPGAPSR